MPSPDQDAIREKMKEILTRNAGRIPERLEADLDQLVALMVEYGRECRVDELEKFGDQQAQSDISRADMIIYIHERLAELQKEKP